MQKFENMDVIAALEAIMHQNTAYYQSDFAYDIKMMREAARSDQPEDKLLLWLSRPSGTFCFRERDVLLKDTQAYNTWKFWCCTIKVDIENSKGQYIEKDKQEATKDGSESTKIQHGI